MAFLVATISEGVGNSKVEDVFDNLVAKVIGYWSVTDGFQVQNIQIDVAVVDIGGVGGVGDDSITAVDISGVGGVGDGGVTTADISGVGQSDGVGDSDVVSSGGGVFVRIITAACF